MSVVTAATAFAYARLLEQQGDWPDIDSRQAFVLAFLIAVAVVGVVGTFARPATVRAAAAAACAGGLLPLGFVALFSIGLPLMTAGALAVIAWRASTDSSRATLAASAATSLVAIAVLAVGFAVSG